MLPRSFDAIEVLTRAGLARDECCALLDQHEIEELDALLVSDLLRVAGQVGATLDRRRELVELCALLRAIDAAQRQRIALEELRAGLALHAARTDRFERFHDARVLLRTLAEVLEHAAASPDSMAVDNQVSLLHDSLRSWLHVQLTGDEQGLIPDRGVPVPPIAPDPRAPMRLRDARECRRADELVDELLHGARDHPVTGMLGAAWIRGWSAVPVAGEMLGDDLDELERLERACALLMPPPAALLQVERRRPPRWQLDGTTMLVGDRRRRAWSLPATADGLALAATPRPAWSILTTSQLQFAWIEGAGHHAILGPAEFVEAACGMPPLEAVAAFREHVEALAVDGDPPADLLEVATSFGRLRRRSR